MTNTALLREKIAKSGLKMGFIADKLNLTHSGFLNKINNRSEFKASEIIILKALLGLSTADVNAIFFDDEVEKKTTKGGEA